MKTKLTIYISTAIGLIATWLFVAFAPHFKEIKEIDARILESEQQLADFQRTILMLPEYVKTREELAKRKAMLNSSLYTKDNIISLFEQFYAIADKHSMEIIEITPPVEELLMINRTLPDSAGLMFLNVSLRVEGNYQNYGRFVEEIEGSAFFRGPNRCNVFGTTDNKTPVQYDFGFKSLLGSLKKES